MCKGCMCVQHWSPFVFEFTQSLYHYLEAFLGIFLPMPREYSLFGGLKLNLRNNILGLLLGPPPLSLARCKSGGSTGGYSAVRAFRTTFNGSSKYYTTVRLVKPYYQMICHSPNLTFYLRSPPPLNTSLGGTTCYIHYPVDYII